VDNRKHYRITTVVFNYIVTYLPLLKLFIMPKKDPWHSIKQDVHHNNTNCNTGNNIERENLRSGTGGKPLCKECEKANREGR